MLLHVWHLLLVGTHLHGVHRLTYRQHLTEACDKDNDTLQSWAVKELRMICGRMAAAKRAYLVRFVSSLFSFSFL